MFQKNNLTRILTSAATVAALILIAPAAKADTLTGAGSTFINPIMSQWSHHYKDETGTEVNYQSIGSGGGINMFINQTVDFAGTDVPMNPGEKAQVKGGYVTIPDILGAVVVGYNIPGVGAGIHLSGPVLADIFQGKITVWNDPRITALNPGTTFPNDNILVVHRSDGSGTTAIFTDYLSKVSGDWRNNIGSGKSVNWPTGLGGKGSEGVAGYLKTKPCSIGYFELAYAITKVIYYAAIENKKGNFIYPFDASSATKAAEGEPMPGNLEMSITNTSNPEGYPISGYSYLIVPEHSQTSPAVKKFVTWIITKGQDPSIVAPLHYAPIPDAVRDRALALLAK